MATPRKNWFKAYNSLLCDFPDPEARGIVVGLLCLYSERWADGGIDVDQAHILHLSKPDLHRITGRERHSYGLALLEKALGTSSARVRHGLGTGSASARCGAGTVVVEWVKWPELQELGARSPGKPRVQRRGEERREKKEQTPTESDPAPPARQEPRMSDHAPNEPSTDASTEPVEPEQPALTGIPTAPSPWIRVIRGLEVAGRARGQPPDGYEDDEQWLAEHLPIALAEAKAETGETSGTKFNGKVEALLCRWWRNLQGGRHPARSPPFHGERPGGPQLSPGHQRMMTGFERIEERAREQERQAKALPGARKDVRGLPLRAER